MNNKGQSLVLFLMLLPLLIMAFAFIFDSSVIIMENNKLQNLSELAITYMIKNDEDEETIRDFIIKNDKDIKIIKISITNNEVHLAKDAHSYFGKILGYEKYELEIDMTGHIKNNKIEFEKKG